MLKDIFWSNFFRNKFSGRIWSFYYKDNFLWFICIFKLLWVNLLLANLARSIYNKYILPCLFNNIQYSVLLCNGRAIKAARVSGSAFHIGQYFNYINFWYILSRLQVYLKILDILYVYIVIFKYYGNIV